MDDQMDQIVKSANTWAILEASEFYNIKAIHIGTGIDFLRPLKFLTSPYNNVQLWFEPIDRKIMTSLLQKAFSDFKFESVGLKRTNRQYDDGYWVNNSGVWLKHEPQEEHYKWENI